MRECYQAYQRGSDLVNIELFVEEGQQYFFIMSHIRHYDTSKEYIGPSFEFLDPAIYQVIFVYCDNERLDSLTLVRVGSRMQRESARANATDFAFVSALCVSLVVFNSSTKRGQGT
jgi:hypothetical protein